MSLLKKICDANNINLVPIRDDVAKIFEQKGIDCNGAGFAMQMDSKKIIFFDLSTNKWANRNIIAHELGHHLLDHLTTTGIGTEVMEQESRIFAATLMSLMLWDEYRANNRD